MTDNKPITILNVDDDEAGRYAISRTLRQAGFEVIEAATGQDGLRLAARQPDLIILDVNLPDIDGFEVCRRLKADPTTSVIPVMHLSATRVDTQARVAGLEGGADAYLTQPIEPSVLLATVKALLRTRQAEAETRRLLAESERTRHSLLSLVEDQKRAEEKVRRLAAKLKAIARPARQMSALLDVDELVQQVVQSLQEITGCYNANFFLREGDALVLAAGQGGYEDGRPPGGYRLSLGQGIIGRAAQTGQAVLVPDVSQDAHYMAWEGLPHTRSELAVPVKRGDEVLGVIDMQSTQPNTFDAADLEALGVLGDQLAVALQNARLFEETEQRALEMISLYTTSLRLATAGELNELLQTVVRQAVTLLQATGGGLYLYDQAADELEWVTAYGAGEEKIGTRLKPGEGLSGKVMLERRPVVVEDYHTWEGRSSKYEGQSFTAVAAVPLLWHDQLIGVLDVMDDKERRTFNDDDVRLLSLLAQQAAAAIANARSLQAEQKRAEQLTVINELGRALATTLDLSTIYHFAYRYVQRLVDCPNFAISLFDPQQQLLTMAFCLSDDAEMDPTLFPPLPYEPQARTGRSKAIASGQPVIVRDLAAAMQASDNAHAIGDGQEPLSALYAPMAVEGQVMGLLEVQSYLPQAYTQEDVELLDSVANQIGLAIQNTRLFKRTRQRSEELAVLHRAALIAASAPNLDALLEQVVEIVGAALYPDNFGFLLLDAETQTLRPHPSYRGVSPEALGMTIALGQGITGRVAQTGQPLLVPDVTQAEGYLKVTPEARSELCVPLETNGRILGVINAESRRPHAFTQDDLRLLSTLAGQLATALERVRLFDETRRRLEHLQALRAIDTAIASNLDLRVTLDVLLDQATVQLGVDAADVLLLDPYTHTLEYAAGRGFHTRALQHTRLRLSEGHAGRAAFERQIVNIADLRQARDAFERAPLLDGEKFIAYYAAPLIAKGQVKGVLEIFHRAPLASNREWIDFLDALAGQAAIAIDNAELFDNLQRSNVELGLAYDTTLEGWARALELRDQETEGHSHRVTELTLRMARAMGIGEAELVHVRRGALLHDIGKMGISDTILLKPGSLTEAEWEIMRQHPVYAYQLLSPIAFLRPALDIPYHHHEKWDGSGYPQGLKGAQIPLTARIFAVVDVWDALLSDRPYRDAWPEEKAREYIREQAGKHFDPRVVDVFFDLLALDS